MATSKFSWFGILVTLILVAIVVIGSIVVWSRYSVGQPVVISESPNRELHGEIYVIGAVNNPGLYPLIAGDSIGDAIQAAGGAIENADLSQLKLYISKVSEKIQPQRIDINRAEIWLLKSLPGIGEARAEAIVDYRRQVGPFRSIRALIKVEGIGATIYEQIEELVTVAD